MDGHILKYVAILVCAPVLEELVFRKFILDRTRHFGEVNALFLSAVCFGLFHMNFYQFFYAFGIGLVFGYVYLRTGRARYSMIMHAIINFFGGVLAPWVLSLMQDMPADAPMDLDMVMETIGPVLLTLAFSFLIMAAFVAGLVLLILNARKLHWFRYPQELPRGRRFSVPYINVGMILFVLLCGVFMVLNLL